VFKFVILFLEGFLVFSLKSDWQSKKCYICLRTVCSINVCVGFPDLSHSKRPIMAFELV
jgi:hypothetical protein